MLKLKKVDDKKDIEISIMEAQSLIDCLNESDKDFKEMIQELVSFYKLEERDLLDRLILNLSYYKLSEDEIQYRDLRSMARLSALSLIMPRLKPVAISEEFVLDQMNLDYFMESRFKQA